MDHNQALWALDKVHSLQEKLLKGALQLEDAVKGLDRNALNHTLRIIVGILSGIRMYLIKNEDEIIQSFMEMEVKNGKKSSKKDDKTGKKGF